MEIISTPNDYVLRILLLIEDSRLLAAKEHYDIFLAFLDLESTRCRDDYLAINELLVTHQAVFTKLVERYNLTIDAIRSVEDVSSVGSEWILGSQLFEVDTYYRLEEDGLISVRMEAVHNDCLLFEQLSVLYEGVCLCLYMCLYSVVYVCVYTDWSPSSPPPPPHPPPPP